MSNAKPLVWRKTTLVLLDALRVPFLQLLATLLIILGGGVLENLLGVRPDLIAKLSLAVIICGIWTTTYLTRQLRAVEKAEKAKEGGKKEEETAAARRKVLLAKLSAPARRLAAGVTGLMSIIMSLAVLISALVREEPLIPFIAGYYLFLAAWIGVEIWDWYNDQYILTEDRIIDITRLPLIYEQRTEAPLAMVQNATVSRSGWGIIFDFGNVLVETAGYARPLLFENVPHPQRIQEQIFQRIDVLAKRQRREQQAQLAAQTQQWFAAYHTLTQGIRDIQFPVQVEAGQPFAIKWRVQGPPGRPYRTWLVWDVVSRLTQGGEYAYAVRPYSRPAYQGTVAQDPDGVGSGLHVVRGMMLPSDVTNMYFRIAVQFDGNQVIYSSPEMSIRVAERYYV
ncbi:MAG: PH domain-containing protein [Anaerolineae bacterium]